MKFVYLILLTATSLSAMQEVKERPKSKHECFLAYTKFQALIQTCKHSSQRYYSSSITSVPNIEERQKCVADLYEKFLTACIQEREERKAYDEKALSLGHDPRSI